MDRAYKKYRERIKKSEGGEEGEEVWGKDWKEKEKDDTVVETEKGIVELSMPPIAVKMEIIIDLANVVDISIINEWNEIKTHDVLLLCKV
jgi:hypothetical protein